VKQAVILLPKLYGNGLVKIRKNFNLFTHILNTNLEQLKKNKRNESKFKNIVGRSVARCPKPRSPRI